MTITVPCKSFGVVWNWIPKHFLFIWSWKRLQSHGQFAVSVSWKLREKFPLNHLVSGWEGAVAEAERGRECVRVPPGLIQWVLRRGEIDPWGSCTDRPEEPESGGGGRETAAAFLFVLPLNNTAQWQPANKSICESQERIRGGMITCRRRTSSFLMF